MDHAALYWAGANDGDLNHQVVKRTWLKAGQHTHLRAALDLKHADCISAADHVVGSRVFCRYIG